MSGMRRMAAWVAMAAVVGGLAGCGSSPADVGTGDGEATTSPAVTEPTGPSATSSPLVAAGAPTFGAGTPLGDDVEVVDGSALVGSVVPLVSQNVSDEDRAASPGWQALLVVDGDPFAVWDAYAAALGLADVASARQACVVERASGMTADQRFIAEDPLDGEQRLRCWVRADDRSMYLVVGSVACRGDGDPCALPAAHLFLARQGPTSSTGIEGYIELGTSNLRLDRAGAERADPEPATDAGSGEPTTDEPGAADRGEPVVPASASAAAPVAGATAVHASTDVGEPSVALASIGSLAGFVGRVEEDQEEPVAIPDGPIQPPRFATSPDPVFPGPGERMDLGLDYFVDGETAALLPDDVRSLVVPTMAIRCNSGLVTALDAPGSPVDVVQSFAPGMLGELAPPLTGAIDGSDWATFTYDQAGGMKLSMTAIDTGSGRSFVLVTECGD